MICHCCTQKRLLSHILYKDSSIIHPPLLFFPLQPVHLIEVGGRVEVSVAPDGLTSRLWRCGGGPGGRLGRGSHVAGALVVARRRGQVGVGEHALHALHTRVAHYQLLGGLGEVKRLMALVIPHGGHMGWRSGQEASWLLRRSGVAVGGGSTWGRQGVLRVDRLWRRHEAMLRRRELVGVSHAGRDALLPWVLLHELKLLLLLKT